MKKQITTITLGILMLTGVMAMYGGENHTFETNLINPVYTVVGNSSNLEGLNISFENKIITISPALNYKPDNFTLIFFDNISREVIKVIRRGGGNSVKTKYIDNNVTVYVPEYINTTNEVEVEVEVEKIVNNETIVETGFKLWHILFAMVVGGVFIFFKMWKIKEKSAEEIMEDVEKDRIKNEEEAKNMMEELGDGNKREHNK